MPIGPSTPMIEKVPRVGVFFFLETTWFLGLEKIKIAYLSLQRRQNILSLAAAVCNLSG